MSYGVFAKLSLLVWIGVTALIPARAQSPEESTALERYIQIGIENNLALLNQELEVERNRSELREARSWFLPELSLEATYSFSEGGRTIDIPVGDLFNPVHNTLNELAGEPRFPVDLENVSEQLLPDNYHETRLHIVQPLFNTDLYYSYRARKHRVSQEEARRQAMLNELVKEIKTGYYNYLKTEELLSIYRSTHSLLRELVRVNRRLVENEKATQDVVYTAEYELQQVESQQADARRQQESARAYFNFLLNRKLDASIDRDSVSNEPDRNIDLSLLQQQAPDMRAEFSQIEQGIAANQDLLNLNRSHALPELFVAGDVGYQGFEYRFDDSQDFWFVRFGLRWNLFRGFQNRERIKQSRLEIRKLENRYEELEKQIRLQVIDAWHAWEAARKTLEAKQAGFRAAKAGFRIVQRKYEENQVLLVEYLEAQNNYTNARLQQAIARYDLLARKAELEHAAGWTGNWN